MAPYFVTAITWGWVAWRTGSLLLSMGLHVGNNTFLVLFVNSRGDVIQSGAPFVLENLTLPHTIIAGIIHAVLTIIIVEFVMRRRERKAGSAAV